MSQIKIKQIKELDVIGATSGYFLNWTGSTLSAVDPSGDGLTLEGGVISVDNSVIRTTGTQSISGEKTFTDKLTINSTASSGEVVFDIQGSQGQLFSISDSLTGLLFSVNDISGIPVFEAYSDGTLKLGSFGSPEILITPGTISFNLEEGSTQSDILVMDSQGNLFKRSDLSLQGATGPTGSTGATGPGGDSFFEYDGSNLNFKGDDVAPSGNTVSGSGNFAIGTSLSTDSDSNNNFLFGDNITVTNLTDGFFLGVSQPDTAENGSTFLNKLYIDDIRPEVGNGTGYLTIGESGYVKKQNKKFVQLTEDPVTGGIIWDFRLGSSAKVDSVTLGSPISISNIENGDFGTLIINGQGGDISWTGWFFPGGTAPVVTQDEVTIVSFLYDGTNYYGNSSQNYTQI